MQVLTNTLVVIDGFLDNLLNADSRLYQVWAPDLSFEEATKELRARNYTVEESQDPILMFVWNRSIIRVERSLQRRSNFDFYGPIDDNGEVNIYRAVLGSIDINFTLYTNDINELEYFEILYETRSSISDIRKISVSHPFDSVEDIVLDYNLEWYGLENLTTVKRNQFYSSVSGSLTLTGVFATFINKGNVIKDIYLNIYNYNDLKLGSRHIS